MFSNLTIFPIVPLQASADPDQLLQVFLPAITVPEPTEVQEDQEAQTDVDLSNVEDIEELRGMVRSLKTTLAHRNKQLENKKGADHKIVKRLENNLESSKKGLRHALQKNNELENRIIEHKKRISELKKANAGLVRRGCFLSAFVPLSHSLHFILLQQAVAETERKELAALRLGFGNSGSEQEIGAQLTLLAGNGGHFPDYYKTALHAQHMKHAALNRKGTRRGLSSCNKSRMRSGGSSRQSGSRQSWSV